ncbi:MAG: heterodisulfide reductase-related iron-sulfur binding cluster [Gemmatimonadetes bacterium]|nr:heterodisulfide reductase-related iron-sulfur binding cluster [Gemmatimonadota bacterium]
MTARAPLPGSELCVHCGFCMQACPTYLALDDENDSPRGRIVLMKALAAGTIADSDPFVGLHLDQCLGCRACETACPSGVPYGQLLEATRERQATVRPTPLVSRIVLRVFERPAVLGVVMFGARVLRATGLPWLLAKLPGRIGASMAMLESTRRPGGARARVAMTPSTLPTAGKPTKVATLDGCVMEGLFAATNRATERVLAINGYAVTAAPGQQCCGALHVHAGDADAARTLARVNIAAFEQSGAEFVAVNSAGCGAMLKEYGHLLKEDAAWHERATIFSKRVKDVSELLADAGPRAVTPSAGAPRVTYDAPCHLLHAQRIADAPMRVLRATGATLIPLPDAEQCCGSAGLYSLVEPSLSQRVLSPKLAHIAATGAQVVATGNPGCLMHIGAGLVRSGAHACARHPVELLDDAYAAERTP